MEHLKITYQCHENWNDFTPTQQGAFCQKCKIDVKDFTQMSNDEIKDYLEKNSNSHLCGRFGVNQIIGFNNDVKLWTKNNHQTLQAKFVFVLLVTFGLTLFSCTNQAEKYQINKLAETINKTTNSLQQPQPEVNEETTKKDTETTQIVIKNQDRNESQKQKFEAPIVDKDSTFCGGSKSFKELFDIPELESHIMGLVVYRPEIDTVLKPIKDTTEIKKSSNIDETTIDYKLFPNPTTDETNLIIDVKQEDYFLITLVDLTGNVLQEIFNGELMVGEQRFFIDLNDYSTGYYLITVQTKSINESYKILKTD